MGAPLKLNTPNTSGAFVKQGTIVGSRMTSLTLATLTPYKIGVFLSEDVTALVLVAVNSISSKILLPT